MQSSFSQHLCSSLHKTLLLRRGIILVEHPSIVQQTKPLLRLTWHHHFLDEDKKLARADLLHSVLQTMSQLQEPVVSWFRTQLQLWKNPDQPIWYCAITLYVSSDTLHL